MINFRMYRYPIERFTKRFIYKVLNLLSLYQCACCACWFSTNVDPECSMCSGFYDPEVEAEFYANQGWDDGVTLNYHYAMTDHWERDGSHISTQDWDAGVEIVYRIVQGDWWPHYWYMPIVGTYQLDMS